MSVYIGELASEVVAEPEPTAAAGGPAPGTEGWKAVDRLRAADAILAGIALRTRAEGFDD